MKLNIVFKINKNIKDNVVDVNIESAKKDSQIDELLNYINRYESTIVTKVDNKLVKIQYKDIRYFYCKNKEIYCKTKNKEYKVKSRLYELEKLDKDFIRVSKKYVVNFNHAECFDMGRIGKIVIELDNREFVTVSRRRIRDVIEYLDERLTINCQ